MKILFLVPYPLKEAPSQRFRFEQYFEILERSGIHYKVKCFLSPHNANLFSGPGNYRRKAVALMQGFARRVGTLFEVPRFDFVFIHREAAPVGPPFLEWIIFVLHRKKIIYDFDDAIWLSDKPNEHPITSLLKWRGKVKSICKWSYRVSCGNDFLGGFARQFNPRVVVNPTTIDTLHTHTMKFNSMATKHDKLTIGWTGSRSTIKYLDSLEPVLIQIERKYPTVQFLVIADVKPSLKLNSLVFQRWSTSTEIEDLAKMDIGIMPLADDLWSRGKCGFKALQYMAMKIPAVVSPVGVNTKIVDDGVNGFLCKDEKEWTEKLEMLIADRSLRVRMGKAGLKKIEAHYSVTSNTDNFLLLFS